MKLKIICILIGRRMIFGFTVLIIDHWVDACGKLWARGVLLSEFLERGFSLGKSPSHSNPPKKAWNRCQGVFVLISASSAHSCCAEITGIFSKQLYQPHYGQRRNLEISSSQTNFPCLVLPRARNNSSSTLDLIGCHIFP